MAYSFRLSPSSQPVTTGFVWPVRCRAFGLVLLGIMLAKLIFPL